MLDLRRRHYRVIYADPPWRFKVWGENGDGRSPDQHYCTMPLHKIAALPVNEIAAKDAVLFLWVVQSMIPEALRVITAWNFVYRTVGFYWIKTAKRQETSGLPWWNAEIPKVKIGLGYHTRACAEQCFLATRGKGYRRTDRSVSQIVFEPPREHSRKPDEVARRIVQLTGDLERIELFARGRRQGWDVWGHEAHPP